MELVKKLGTRIVKGRLESWGAFLCSFCNKIVEMRLSAGKICKSCGCKRKELISKGNKGKKRTEEQKETYSKAFKGKKKSEIHKQKLAKGRKGKKLTEEQNKRKSERQKGRKHTEETRQLMREKAKGRIISEETRQKIKENHADFSLENNPQWNNGSSFLPYPPEFNKELKQLILERDNYTCQNPECTCIEKIDLHIHHIDYDKKNNNLDNLTVLCNSCHSKTNGKNNRQYWTEYYNNILKTRGY